MKYLRCLVSASLALALAGCGNSSDDRPEAPPEIPKPPLMGHQPELDNYANISKLNLEPLVGLSGNDLLQGIEKQLNEQLNGQLNTSIKSIKNANGKFTITPRWGVGNESWDINNLHVIETGGQFVLETTLPAEAVGKPGANNKIVNGFGFVISLPSGLTKEAALSYNFKLSTPLGFGDTVKSPDYIFLPGFTSGDPAVINKPSDPGTGFTYKYSTDRYGYINTRYTDPTDNTYFNQQLKFNDKPVKISSAQWNLVQQKLKANSFVDSVAKADGIVETSYNKAALGTAAGNVDNRVNIDERHSYNLEALMEVYRYYQHKADSDSDLKEQVIQIKDISFAWNNDQVTLPPPLEYKPDLGAYTHISKLNLEPLEGLSGSQLFEGIEAQLNATLDSNNPDNGQFVVTPRWGDGTDSTANLEVVNINGQFALKTTIEAGVLGKPSADNNVKNGFGFVITLPNGRVKKATLAYKFNLSTPLGSDAAKSPDYIFLPGFTSGDPKVVNNPSDPGAGFTYKYTTDRYGYLNTRFIDPTNKAFFNQQFKINGDGVKVNSGNWNLVQQKLVTNDFIKSTATTDGSIQTLYNEVPAQPKAGDVVNRVIVDEEHDYALEGLFELYRHYMNTADDTSALKEQEVFIKDITFAWNDEEISVPEPSDGKQPDLDEFPNIAKLNLEPLAGLNGKDLFLAIEAQLNSTLNLPGSTDDSFKVIPQWGSGEGSWDVANLSVVENNGQYVLQTTIDPEAVGKPSETKPIQNGFGFIIELPNGLVKEATLAYQFKLSTQLGYKDPTESPDYIFLPGFTSGNPEVGNKPSEPDVGFTYKYTTDRYGKLNTRFMDPTDNVFFNQELQQDGNSVRVKSGSWNLVQQNLVTNDFIGSVATSNGSLETRYNTSLLQPKAGEVIDRTVIDETHAYNLTALVEVYRHYKHPKDDDSKLKEQVIQLKDITLAWKNEQVSLPKPVESNTCSIAGFAHSRALDLSALSNMTGQKLLDAIADQLGGLPAGTIQFDFGVDNLAVVSEGEDFALEVTYGETLKGKKVAGNGIGFNIPFPLQAGTTPTGACFAYDMHINEPVKANSDYIYIPGIRLNDGDTLLSDHRYTNTKYNRFAAKFVNPPHGDLKNLDYNNPRFDDTIWNSIRQTMTMDEQGKGTLDFRLNNDSYFAINAGKLDGQSFETVQHQLVPADKLSSLQLVANFDTYRHYGDGIKKQTFRYRNIAIGWNTNQ